MYSNAPQHILDQIAKNLADIGAIALGDYLDAENPVALTQSIRSDRGPLFVTSESADITSAESSSAGNISSDARSVHSETTFVEDIEQCCLEWHATRVTPNWVPFADTKSAQKQGCALRIQLSPHVAHVYLADPTFDTYSDAKSACAKAAVLEGVLEFIKHGTGQTHPSSPGPSSLSAASLPWTLQSFCDSLPRPFPESFGTDDASEINAPGWLNTLVQNARGGKLILSFFFTSDGPPGLHGCLLKLDRPGEYKAFLVDAGFPKRSDAKAAVCLQAMSKGIGNYIRSIASTVDTKITPAMRSFSSSLVYPALTSELSKIHSELHPRFEYDKERDAFGATLVVRLSTLSTPEQARRYTVSNDYRNKADAKVAVVCHAAELGVVEFVRFRGGTPPDDYTSPYILHTYNPDASRKRKQPGSVEDAEQGQPAKKKKKKKKKGSRQVEVPSHDEGSHLTPVGQHMSVHPSSDQSRVISGSGDVGLPQSGVPMNGLRDPSRLGVESAGGSGVAHSGAYGHGVSHNAQMYASPYAAVLDPRFVGNGGSGSRGYGVYPLSGVYGSGSHPPRAVDAPHSQSGPWPEARSHAPHRRAKHAELEPGEVVSSAESTFSESSSRNEDGEVQAKEEDTDANENGDRSAEKVAWGSKDKGKGKETSPTNTSTSTTCHVQKLIEYCATRHCGTPSFHEVQGQGRFQVWIVIGKERFDLPTTYGSAEEGRERVAKQVLARLSKGSLG